MQKSLGGVHTRLFVGFVFLFAHWPAYADSGPVQASATFIFGAPASFNEEVSGWFTSDTFDDVDQWDRNLINKHALSIISSKCLIKTREVVVQQSDPNVPVVTYLDFNFSNSFGDISELRIYAPPSNFPQFSFDYYSFDLPKGTTVEKFDRHLRHSTGGQGWVERLLGSGRQLASESFFDRPWTTVRFKRGTDAEEVKARLNASLKWYKENVCDGGF